MQREVQRVVDVVVEVGAGADHEVNRAALHQRDDRAADARRSHRAGDGQADRDVLLRIEHAIGVESRRLVEPAGVIRLERAIHQVGDGHLRLDAVAAGCARRSGNPPPVESKIRLRQLLAPQTVAAIPHVAGAARSLRFLTVKPSSHNCLYAGNSTVYHRDMNRFR